MCAMSTASHTRKQGHEDYGEACTHDNAWVCKCMQTFSFIKPEKNRPKPVTTHATHGYVLNMQGWQPHSTERRNPFVRGSPEHFLRASRAKEERRSRSCLWPLPCVIGVSALSISKSLSHCIIMCACRRCFGEAQENSKGIYESENVQVLYNARCMC